MIRLAAALLLLVPVVFAAGPNRMVILHLNVSPDAVTLLGSTNVVGRARRLPDVEVGIRCQFLAVDGADLGSTVIPNPRIERSCVPEDDGSIATRFQVLTNAQVDLRIDADVGIKTVRFTTYGADPKNFGDVDIP